MAIPIISHHRSPASANYYENKDVSKLRNYLLISLYNNEIIF